MVRQPSEETLEVETPSSNVTNETTQCPPSVENSYTIVAFFIQASETYMNPSFRTTRGMEAHAENHHPGCLCTWIQEDAAHQYECSDGIASFSISQRTETQLASPFWRGCCYQSLKKPTSLTRSVINELLLFI